METRKFGLRTYSSVYVFWICELVVKVAQKDFSTNHVKIVAVQGGSVTENFLAACKEFEGISDMDIVVIARELAIPLPEYLSVFFSPPDCCST